MASGLKKSSVKKVGGHSYTEAEKVAYVDFINSTLEDQNIPGLPIDSNDDSVFKCISNGVILPNLIYAGFEESVDIKKIVISPKNKFEANQNHDIAIDAAKSLGCSVVNIGGEDLYKGVPHLVMGILWQIIKKTLLSQVALCSDLARLATGDESADTIMKAPPEQILLRWFNYHLKAAGHHRTVTNFGSDLADSELYATLMAQIAPDDISDKDLEIAYRQKDQLKRAEIICGWAERLDCKKFVTPKAIVDGNPRLNLAFVATLFNQYPSLGPTEADLAKEKAKKLEDQLFDIESLLEDTKVDLEGMKETLENEKKEKSQVTEKLQDVSLKLAETVEKNSSLVQEKLELGKELNEVKSEKKSLFEDLEKMISEKDDLFSQLEDEIGKKLEFETQLEDTQKELEKVKEKASKDELDWLSKLEEEIDAKENLEVQLDQTKQELEQTKKESEKQTEELFSQLESEISAKEELSTELDQTKSELEKTKQQSKKMEDDLFSQLESTIEEMETHKLEAKQEQDKLRQELDEERRDKEEAQNLLAEKEKQFTKQISESDDEKLALIARIEQLEAELAALRKEMKEKLEAAEQKRIADLKKANEEKNAALEEAENEKDMALEKVRMLLSGNQKEGEVELLGKSLAGLGQAWKKRWLIIRDGYLCFYKSQKDSKKEKPLSMINCETTRLYEMSEDDTKKPNCFQIDSGNQQWNVHFNSADEMRDWMTIIRVAKKKKLGVKVVSSETKEQRKQRELKMKSPRGNQKSSSSSSQKKKK